MDAVVSFYLVIRPEKISWLRFILEGYDNLAILSTLSATEGLVRLQCPRSLYAETMSVIAALSPGMNPYCQQEH